MKVKDFIKIEQDIDVFDNVCEELAIAFCGAIKLTKEGKKKFADVLEYDIDVRKSFLADVAVIDIDYDDWKDRLKKAKEFFYSVAGYCSEENYDKWFVEV